MNTVTDRRSRLDWRWLALALSLVCNVFLAALIGGFLLRHHAYAVGVTAAAPLTRLERVQVILSPKDAATFRAVLEHDEPLYAQAARQEAEARRALERQITAEPFDPHAAIQALDTWRKSWNTLVHDLGGPLIDALAAISPEGRSRLAADRRAREEQFRRSAAPSP